MPADYNYMTPDVPVVINGKADATSQRFHVGTIYPLFISLSHAQNLGHLRIVFRGADARHTAL
jgi:hypothetical protein